MTIQNIIGIKISKPGFSISRGKELNSIETILTAANSTIVTTTLNSSAKYLFSRYRSIGLHFIFLVMSIFSTHTGKRINSIIKTGIAKKKLIYKNTSKNLFMLLPVR